MGFLRLCFMVGLIVVSVLLSIFEIKNDDAGFHVANGIWILEHGSVPLHNPFSYSEDGAVWTQHQWLSALWMATITNHFGPQGLIIWKASLVGITFLILGAGLRQTSLEWATTLALIALGACCYRFVERPYLVTMLLMAINLQGIILLRRGEQTRLGISACLVSTLLSLHFHAGGFYNLLLLLALAGEGVIASIRPSCTSLTLPHRQVIATVLGIIGLGVISIWLFAPSGLDVLALPFGFSKHTYWNAHLGEFRPFPIHWDATPQWILIGCSFLTCLLCFRQKNVLGAFAIAGFTLLAIRHARMIYPLAIVFLSIAGSLTFPALRPSRMSITLVIAGLLTFSWGASGHLERTNFGLGKDGFDRARHPIELMELCKDLPGETFVSDGLAGTWLWLNFDSRATPKKAQRRVLIHNCLECYKEKTYRDLYQHIRYGKPGWAEKVNALGINSFLLKHTTPGERSMQKGQPNIRQHLYQSPDWILMDFDDVASVYVRAEELPPHVSSLSAFPVDPDSWKPKAFDTPWPEIRTALLSHSESHPEQTRALLITSQLALQIGDLKTLEESTRTLVKRHPDSAEAASAMAMLRRASRGKQ